MNHIDGNGLTDWTNINAAEQQFAQITDPNTGEPIILPGRRVLIAPQIQALSLNQLMAGQTAWKFTSGGADADCGPPAWPRWAPTRCMDLQHHHGHQPAALQAAAVQLGLSSSDAGGYWFYGDPAAFAYMENWPITTVLS